MPFKPKPQDPAKVLARVKNIKTEGHLAKSRIPSGTLAGVFHKLGGNQAAMDMCLMAADEDIELAKMYNIWSEMSRDARINCSLEELCRVVGLAPHDFIGRIATVAYKRGRAMADLMIGLKVADLTGKALESALEGENANISFKDREALLRKMGVYPDKQPLVTVQQNNQTNINQSTLPAFESQADSIDRALQAHEAKRKALPAFVEGEVVDSN
jgi:hypothetical protein